jgi:hypothetical protein
LVDPCPSIAGKILVLAYYKNDNFIDMADALKLSRFIAIQPVDVEDSATGLLTGIEFCRRVLTPYLAIPENIDSL